MAGDRRIRLHSEAPSTEDDLISKRVAGVHEPAAGSVEAAQHHDLACLKHAVEQSNDAGYITDSAPRIEFVNSVLASLTGLNRVESIGRLVDYLNGHVPASQSWFGEQSPIGKRFSTVVVQRRKQGDIFHADINVRPFVDMLGCQSWSENAAKRNYKI